MIPDKKVAGLGARSRRLTEGQNRTKGVVLRKSDVKVHKSDVKVTLIPTLGKAVSGLFYRESAQKVVQNRARARFHLNS